MLGEGELHERMQDKCMGTHLCSIYRFLTELEFWRIIVEGTLFIIA